VLDAEQALDNTVDCDAVADSRPMTKFEHRGLRLGHEIWDFVYRRR
jgi:tRNA (guanine-N7-)-methyltransferase